MNAFIRRTNRHTGFTLVEVLVALLVLSIGLLGIGKLVMFSARSNDSAYMRGQATALAYSILDAMRANRQVALGGSYDIAAMVGVAGCSAASPCLCTAGVPCNATAQAQSDLYLWKTRLQAELPVGDGSVVTATVADPVTGVANVTATVTVQWNDIVAQQVFGGPAGNATVSLETIL